MQPFVYIYGYPYPMYGIMALFGVVFAVTIALVKRKAFSLRARDVLVLCLFAIIGAFLGAKLFGAIGQIVKHGSEPDFWTKATWLNILGAGGVVYGGLIGGFGMSAFVYLIHMYHNTARQKKFAIAIDTRRKIAYNK